MKRFALTLCGLWAVSLLPIAGCASNNDNGESNQNPSHMNAAPAHEVQQQTFNSPDEAAAAFKQAVQTQNRHELLQIFGNDGRELIFTGDKVQDVNDLAAMSDHMSEGVRADQTGPDKAVLYIGSQNWPFPIPLAKHGNQWSFDTAAGKEELLNRHIGGNELNAISVCHAYVAAQNEYASKDRNGSGMHEFAQHFMSSEGKHDGLYWPSSDGQEISPMGPLVAQARAEGYHPATRPTTNESAMSGTMSGTVNGQTHRHPFHGYFFHILTAQGADAAGGVKNYITNGHMTGGFALIAWPDRWGSSGIMTFMVGPDGKVYQKNLGSETATLAPTIQEFNPDKSWEEVKE